MSSKAAKRIMSDLKLIRRSGLDKSNIFVAYDDDNIFNVKSLIIGPEDTPYNGGFYFFDINFPKDYPSNPPKVKLMTTNKYVRFNPNLYKCGKVCLSILGTWSGPGWTQTQTLSSILLSIQSLLNDNPIQNEPGWEKEVGQRSKDYINIIQYYNIKVAVIDIINYIPDGFEIFKDIMLKYMVKNIEIYRKVISNNEELNNKVLSCFGMQLVYDLRKLEENLTILYSSYSDIYN